MESMPMPGVPIRKAVVGPREAPARCRARAVGMALQEQSGSGAPMMAARATLPMPRPPTQRVSWASSSSALISPAMVRPSSSQGAAERATERVAATSVMRDISGNGVAPFCHGRGAAAYSASGPVAASAVCRGTEAGRQAVVEGARHDAQLGEGADILADQGVLLHQDHLVPGQGRRGEGGEEQGGQAP